MARKLGISAKEVIPGDFTHTSQASGRKMFVGVKGEKTFAVIPANGWISDFLKFLSKE